MDGELGKVWESRVSEVGKVNCTEDDGTDKVTKKGSKARGNKESPFYQAVGGAPIEN